MTDDDSTTKAEPSDDAAEKAQQEEEEVEEAKKVMEELEEGATAKLGPSNLRHHEDGSVTIDGEEVDNPEEYKGEPIPGGPSDPDAPPDPAMIGQDKGDEDDSGSDSDDDDSGS